MSTNYLTISGHSQAEFEISKSRFIAFVQRVHAETEAIEFIQKIKKEHWEARHNCSAYIIGEHATYQKADDDGEPSGTAGKPILEVIKKNNLKDVVIVVTRYFGGIKLGAGGLIRAYSKAATLGIEASTVVEKVLYLQLKIIIDYSLLGTLENNFRINEYLIEDKIFTDKVSLTLLAKVGEEETVKNNIINWTSSQCLLEEGNKVHLEIPIKKITR